MMGWTKRAPHMNQIFRAMVVGATRLALRVVESIDGKPVTIIIFLASPPDRTGPHIQALARISRLMTDQKFRLAMDKAATPDDVYSLISGYESSEPI